MLSHSQRGKIGSEMLWKRYKSDKTFRDELLRKWRESRIRNYERRAKFSPRLTNHEMEVLKSRICGYLAADGSVIIRKENGTNRLHYDIQFYPDHYVLVRLFRKAFKEVYGKEVSIRQKRNFFYVRASDKFAAMDLVSLAKFSSRYWTIPKVLNSKASKKAWLKAYFDCDGYVCKRYVQIQSVNKDGLLKIRNLLNEFGIRSKIYSYQRRQASWNTNHLLNIQGRNMMLNFMHEIGFDHPLKYAKLKEFIGTLIGI